MVTPLQDYKILNKGRIKIVQNPARSCGTVWDRSLCERNFISVFLSISSRKLTPRLWISQFSNICIFCLMIKRFCKNFLILNKCPWFEMHQITQVSFQSYKMKFVRDSWLIISEVVKNLNYIFFVVSFRDFSRRLESRPLWTSPSSTKSRTLFF